MRGRVWCSLGVLLGLLAVLLAVRAPSSGAASGVTGLVHDNHGPVQGVRVRYQGQGDYALTNRTGLFTLPDRPTPGKHLTAWREGYLIAGTRLGSSDPVLSLTPLPKKDNEEYKWVDPGPRGRHSCGHCHAEIYREWDASAHAHSASGRFLELYDEAGGRGWSLLDERPDASGVCAACHAPTATLTEALDLRRANGVTARGVHCDFCHKVADADLAGVGTTHGRFGFQLLRPSLGQLFFGPLDDVDRGEDAYAPVYRESRYCAGCHEGTVLGVHVYGTYSEWLTSPARRQGKQCQTCHMAPTGRFTNMAPDRGGIERDPQTLANHRFFDGSQEAMLRRCMKLEISAHRDNTVRLEVRVRADDVGHHVPTGFPDRHLVLIVEAFDADGQRQPALDGPILPRESGKELAGKPGQLFGRRLRDDSGRSPAPFWRNASEVADTRLSPETTALGSYVFPRTSRRIHVRVFYRRFWEETAELRGWTENGFLVREQTLELPQ